MISRLRKVLKDQVVQGTTPHKLSFSVASGFAFGLFPIFGTTTTLCLVFGFIFKLNQPAMQAINYLMTPIHLLAIPVFIRLGEKLFQVPEQPFNIQLIVQEFQNNFFEALQKFAVLLGYATVAWLLLAPLLALLVYGVARLAFRKFHR